LPITTRATMGLKIRLKPARKTTPNRFTIRTQPSPLLPAQIH
jgi:hypothetical protein